MSKKERGAHGWFASGPQSFEWLLEFQCVKDWINNYTSEDTRQSYLRCLEKVCRASGLNPDQLLALSGKEAKLIIKRVIQKKLQSGKAAMARRIQVALKGFFEANDKELRFKKIERVKVPAKKVSVEAIPNKLQAYLMADVSGSLRNRAVILCLFQSGVRIGCLCNWRYDHVKDQLYPEVKVPLRIKVSPDMDSKIAGYGLSYYFAFVAEDGAQALKGYIEERKRRGWVPKDEDPIFVTEGSVSRGMQLKPQGAWEIIKNAAQKAGFKREAVWTHVLRKTFRKVLNGTPMDEDTKETLMGHKLPGSRGSYFDYHDVDEVAEKYMKVEWGRTPETRIEKQLREAQEEIQTLKSELARLKNGVPADHYAAAFANEMRLIAQQATKEEMAEISRVVNTLTKELKGACREIERLRKEFYKKD